MLTSTCTMLLDALKEPTDAGAWNAVDARYRPVILGVATRLGLGEADAEEVARETMAALALAHRRGEYGHGKVVLRDWLKEMTRDQIADIRGRQGRQGRSIPTRTDGTVFVEQIEDRRLAAAWDEEWSKAVLRQCLEEVRNEIGPPVFQAFELSALKQWPVREVAAHLQVSEDVVHQARSHILTRIRELLPEMEAIW